MDLSHMIGLWLVGQSASCGSGGVVPGGVGVVYAPLAASLSDAGAGGGGGMVYPFSAGRLVLGGNSQPASEQASRGLQSECESGLREAGSWLQSGVGLIGELEYGADGLEGFVPRLFSAVSVVMWGAEGEAPHAKAQRREGDEEEAEGAEGIAGTSYGSLLNREADSIGLSDRMAFVDRFDREGVLGRARVVGFVERPRKGGSGVGVVQATEDVAVGEFPVMFEKLTDYLRFQVAAQVEGNGYDDLAGVLAKSDRPAHAVVIAGLSHGVASQSRGLVDSGGLEVGDVCHSVVYDSGLVSLEDIRAALEGGRVGDVLNVEGVSWLRQEVV